MQPKMPEPAGSRSLAGPHVHQDSLLPSLYGQIMSLMKPVWLWAPSSLLPPSHVPADFPALGLSLCMHSLSWGATNPAALPWSQGWLPWGADRCQGGGGAGIVWLWTLGMHLVLVTQEMEKNVKPSLQQMPNKRCCFCCISKYHLECWCKQWMQGEKNTELRKIHPSRAPPESVTQDAKTPSSLCTKVTFIRSSRAGFSMLMAQQLSLPSSNNQVSQRARSV